MYDRAHIYILSVPEDRTGDRDPPQQLGEAELKSRLDALAGQLAAHAAH
jgi:hypothetical protein